ncbi:MAG: DinB family protein [Phycisphaerae bacterium]|nr:DinB family protein [Phycisphaerae bacterium]
MLPDSFAAITRSQMDASLTMLRHAIQSCTNARWKRPVGVWPFWLVVYHTLCYVDCYSAPSNRAWKPHPVFHPKGRKELQDEYPSRGFTREEMLDYLDLCRGRFFAAVERETPTSLRRASGFSWLRFTRAELHLYNVRHAAHHTGQLTAALRKSGAKVGWVKAEKPPSAPIQARSPP